jgi:alpha-glucosidase
VPTQTPTLGEVVPVFVRGPVGGGVERVYVRATPDGEPHFTEAVVDHLADGEIWWRADLRVHNPVTNYRFLLVGASGYQWLTGYGVVRHDVPDDTDFRLVTYPPAPAWATDAIVYQIFPDRFARSAAADSRTAPGWAIPCDWDTPVIGRGPETPRQFYGGDLDGIAAHLDHIADLGANTVYLTPIFPARSNHRYDAASFDEIDPLLGGDAALDRLAGAVHERGMRLLGDITTNHTGDAHPWFTGMDRKDLYYIGSDDSYESWNGVSTLPKLDWTSPELRDRFFSGPDSVTARWLRFFDGWRVDVANMTGRLRDQDAAHHVARLMAAAVREARRDGLLVAEHAHDATRDLDRNGWQGTMNYGGFLRPVWSWLGGRTPENFLGVPAPIPRITGPDAVATMRTFASRTSWRALQASWTLLGSHDTARIRTVVGDPALVEVGVGMLATMPGTPMVFAGDEWGMTGDNGEDSRRPMPWDRPETWDQHTYGRYQALFRLRAAHPALRHGGLRFAHVSDDAVAYWRETADERLLILVRRAAGTPVTVTVGAAAGADNRYGGAALDLTGDTATLPADGPTVQVWAIRR